jgi:hypothetical protein
MCEEAGASLDSDSGSVAGAWVDGASATSLSISDASRISQMSETHAAFSSLASVFSASLEASYSSAPSGIFAFHCNNETQDGKRTVKIEEGWGTYVHGLGSGLGWSRGGRFLSGRGRSRREGSVCSLSLFESLLE